MSENIKPVEPVFKAQRIIDIVNQFDEEAAFIQPTNLKDIKRKELHEKMTSEKDKRDFMLLFNGLMITVSLMSIASSLINFSYISIIMLVLSLGYFIFVRRRLTQETLNLTHKDPKNDEYLWKGFYLKEMRFSAVKLAYFLFFPMVLILISAMFLDNGFYNFISNYLIAVVLSSLFWVFFFMDDQQILDSIQSELKTLEHL